MTFECAAAAAVASVVDAVAAVQLVYYYSGV